MVLVIRIVALATWAGVGFLIFMLRRIACFYERSSGKSAYANLFLLPLLFLLGGAAVYLVCDLDFVGNNVADLLWIVGGVLLALATMLLGQVMVGQR